MTNILIIAVMIITLMGAATYGMVSAMRSLQSGIETLVNEDRLEEAAQGVLANIVSVSTNSGKTYYVPAPDNLSMPGVPSWITPNAQTLRGVKFLYCPFSNASGSGSSTITTPNSSYTVNIGQTYTGTYISSNNYVTQSSSQLTLIDNSGFQSPILAILVAPGPGQSAVLSTQDCLNVSATGTIPGATVRVITAQEVQSRAQVIASYGNEFYAASSSSGDGKATSQSNYATFSTVMDYVNKYRPQRVTVDLKVGDTINVAAADMDQTTVSTRQFSAVRNHSILYNGFGSANLQSSVTGTLSPVVLGNLEFTDVLFPGVNNKLLRPMADSFGNIIVHSAFFSYAAPLFYASTENLGRVIFPYNFDFVMTNAASSPTGNEMYYMQRGGLMSADQSIYAITSPSQSYSNYIIYNDFGGSTNLGLFVLNPGNNSNTSPFFVSGGGTLNIGTITVNGVNYSSNSIFSTIYDDTGSRTYMSNFYPITTAVYNQGGLFYSGTIYNLGTDGSGNYTGSNPAAHAATYDILSGPGSDFVITQIAGVTATSATILSNSSTAPYRAGVFIAGNGNSSFAAVQGSETGTNQCFSDETSYNLTSDAGNISGTSLGPKGNIGMEAATILNRSTGTCN